MILPLSTFLVMSNDEKGNGDTEIYFDDIAILTKNQIENFLSLDLPATYLFDLLLWLLENGPSMRQ